MSGELTVDDLPYDDGKDERLTPEQWEQATLCPPLDVDAAHQGYAPRAEPRMRPTYYCLDCTRYSYGPLLCACCGHFRRGLIQS